jgi:hypothetical protein
LTQLVYFTRKQAVGAGQWETIIIAIVNTNTNTNTTIIIINLLFRSLHGVRFPPFFGFGIAANGNNNLVF